MTELALRYARFTGRHPIVVSVPRGGVTRVNLPDSEARVHLVTALLKARGGSGEELELLGTATADLNAKGRDRLRRRVGAVSRVVGLIGNLNAWENISLPAAYHGSPPMERVAQIAEEVLLRLGADPQTFLARLPDDLDTLERKIAEFVRLLVAAPELAVFDAIDDGLSRQDAARVSGFEAEYRARQPTGTLLYVNTRESA